LHSFADLHVEIQTPINQPDSVLHASLRELIEQAETVLQLTDAQRARTVLRIDGGGGETEPINWELARGYLILVKAEGWKLIQLLGLETVASLACLFGYIAQSCWRIVTALMEGDIERKCLRKQRQLAR